MCSWWRLIHFQMNCKFPPTVVIFFQVSFAFRTHIYTGNILVLLMQERTDRNKSKRLRAGGLVWIDLGRCSSLLERLNGHERRKCPSRVASQVSVDETLWVCPNFPIEHIEDNTKWQTSSISVIIIPLIHVQCDYYQLRQGWRVIKISG